MSLVSRKVPSQSQNERTKTTANCPRSVFCDRDVSWNCRLGIPTVVSGGKWVKHLTSHFFKDYLSALDRLSATISSELHVTE